MRYVLTGNVGVADSKRDFAERDHTNLFTRIGIVGEGGTIGVSVGADV